MRSEKYKKECLEDSSTNALTSSNEVSDKKSQKSKKKKKQKKKKTKKKSIKKKVFLTLLFLFMVGIISCGVFVGITISDAPKIDPDNLYERLSESTVIYDDSGKEIDTVYTESNRDIVEYKDLPENLVNAVVALEDKTFWKHHGFNFVRIAGAIKDKIIGGGRIGGTSTITQQLARNIYLKDSRFDRNLKRKIIEAYYAFIIEQNLSKEEILMAYLNTIDFGYHSSGVQAASVAYFSKDVSDLTLSQCAALASLPQSPSAFQLVKLVGTEDIEKDDPNILKTTDEGVWIANDLGTNRRRTCLKLMFDQGYITEKQYNKASKRELRDILNPNYNISNTKAAYFADYVISEVIKDLMDEKGLDYNTAYNKVYNGGVKIYTTLDSQAQNVIENEFSNNANFPNAVTRKDGSGNILNTYGGVALYPYSSYFDDQGKFTFKKDEFSKKKDGSILLRSGKRLNFYNTTVNGETDYSIEFKSMYTYDDSYQLCSINGGYIHIPAQYKSKDRNGNIIISADFFDNDSYKDYFIFNNDGTITVSSKAYTLEQKVVQPQAAMAIVENTTGHIKALVGGRKTTGRKLHNRATSPRQPGSSIKPLGVYSPAIQQSAEEASNGRRHSFTDHHIDTQGTKFWGNYITAGSVVIDEKTHINGRDWPRNAGGGFSGPQTVRTALQKSLNTCAVKIFLQTGANYSADLVEKFGITTLVREGSTNDINAAALALGGMSKGVTPLEMASAYTTFPNNGVRYETTSYTKVEDRNGEVVLNNANQKKYEVLNSGVAWIMTDLLKSVVSSGLGTPATVYGISAGGKTGTTNDQVDIWFDGITPSYSAALWIGNDQNFELTSNSTYAARLWGKIMNQIPACKQGSYGSRPSNVISSGGEYYISGTQGGAIDISKLKEKVEICKKTGYLATPECKHTEEKYQYEFGKDKLPEYYCNKHNKDLKKYPINPKEKPPKVDKPEDEKDNNSDTPNGDTKPNGNQDPSDNTTPPNGGQDNNQTPAVTPEPGNSNESGSGNGNTSDNAGSSDEPDSNGTSSESGN